MTTSLTSRITAAIPVYMAKKLTEVRLEYSLTAGIELLQIQIFGLRLVSEANETHTHWTQKAKRTKFQRDSVMHVLDMCKLQDKVQARLPLAVTITRIAPRSLDTDNCYSSTKHCRDAVAEWLGVNDRDSKSVLYLAEQRKGKPKQYGVEITFETREAYAARLISEAKEYFGRSSSICPDSVHSTASKEHNLGPRLLGLSPVYGAGSLFAMV